MYNQEDWRIASIKKFDIENGTGIGVTLFMQGCTHHCKGCHNPQTWCFHDGEPFTAEKFKELMLAVNNPQITRLTLSGGDPLDSPHFTRYIADWFKGMYPNKSLWIYTGYTYEDIKDDPKYLAILQNCDVLVDGEYIESERDLSLNFRGSRNQRIINLHE